MHLLERVYWWAVYLNCRSCRIRRSLFRNQGDFLHSKGGPLSGREKEMPQELCKSVRSSASQEGLRHGAGNPRGWTIKRVSLKLGDTKSRRVIPSRDFSLSFMLVLCHCRVWSLAFCSGLRSNRMWWWASLVAQMIKNLPAVLETWVWSLG